jgi:hypothetical protein
LKQLDDAGRLQDVAVIAIEEHVDYWDRLSCASVFFARLDGRQETVCELIPSRPRLHRNWSSTV